MADIQGSVSGKTYPEHSRPTEARTSEVSSKKSAKSATVQFQSLDLRSGQKPEKSWQTATLSHGESLMRVAGEFPREENASTLSQILQDNVPKKYYLSPKACQGILRRASERGKELPAVLKKALEQQSVFVTRAENG